MSEEAPKYGVTAICESANASGSQIGGGHYTKLAIQPMEYSMRNGLNACQHSVIKYVTRYKDKGGIEDLRKVRHCIDLLIQYEIDKNDCNLG